MLAAALLLVWLVPYAQPAVCEQTRHGNLGMHQMDGGENWLAPLVHHEASCHDAMGCANTVTPRVVAQAVEVRALPTHFEPPVGFIQSAARNTDPPITPPPRA